MDATGQFVAPQNTAARPIAAANPAGIPQQRAHDAPERRPDKEGGDHLAAP